jgi:hypothetical protein
MLVYQRVITINHHLSVCHVRPKLSSLRDFEVFEVEDIVEASLNFQAQLELQELEEPERMSHG